MKRDTTEKLGGREGGRRRRERTSKLASQREKIS